MEMDRLGAPRELSQSDRLLQVETALESETLVVQSAEWVESVSGHGPDLANVHARYFAQGAAQGTDEGLDGPVLCPFLGVIDAISGSGHLSLGALMGEQVTLRLRLPEGGYRTFHGYVVMASNLGSDNGRSVFRLGVAAFTHFLAMRRDTRVFVQLSVAEVIERVLSAYPQANFRMAVDQPGAVRGIVTQHGETDAAFVARLLAEMGWNWYLTHEEGGPALRDARSAKHCLVITDAWQASEQGGPLHFNREGVLQDDGQAQDTVTHLAPCCEVQANAVTVGSWDPVQLAGVQASRAAGDGALPALEVYSGAGERAHARHDAGLAQDQADTAEAERRASVLLAKRRLQAAQWQGRGTLRGLKVFSQVEITGHPQLSAEQARQQVVSIHHRAANKLSAEVAVEGAPEVAKGTCLQAFTAVASGQEIVPPVPRPEHAKPQVGCETAVVVGWDGQGPLSTNRDLQLRLQFPWQRGDKPLPGGLSGPLTPQGEPTGHATGSAASSVWVRVAQPSAGANWGTTLLARQGTEVLVAYVGGDIDKPVIVGQLHTHADSPPWPVDEGANHAGVISGVHSGAHGQEAANQWLMDDSSGQLRMRLASGGPSAWSELSMGHLIHQGARGGDSRRGTWLGSGYHAHADGWAVLRAQEGLLASTAPRAAAGESAQGTQMDAVEALHQLQGAQRLGERLNPVLASQGAVPLESLDKRDDQALEKLCQAIDPTAQGCYAGPVGGQPASSTRPGTRDLEGVVPKFNAPHIVMQTASALLQASGGPISSFSSQDTSVTAQGDVHLGSAHTVASVSGQTTSVYNQQGPMRFIVGQGDFSLAAHTDALDILADKLIEVRSTDGEIEVKAGRRIELRSGDSKVVLDGANIEYHCNEFIVQSSTHEFAGPVTGEVNLEALPDSRVKTFDEGFVIRDQVTGEPLANMRYRLTLSDGTIEEGITNEQGATHVIGGQSADKVSIELLRK